MEKRFISVWFRHLSTDWFALRQPDFKNKPFVLRASSHGRMLITATNAEAESKEIFKGMALADARAILPDLRVADDKPDLIEKLLTHLAEWCIRFTPAVSIDPPDGLLFDASGCSHLWGGDSFYLKDILKRLTTRGYGVQGAMAGTAGAAWAVARYGKKSLIIENGMHVKALLDLPPESLRLEGDTALRLHKLGLNTIGQFIQMPRSSLRRRFGQHFMMRLDMALGQQMEVLQPVQPTQLYKERLPCLDPIVTSPGIEMALRQLLEVMCLRLQRDQKGLRSAAFKCYRVDGKIETITIGTHRPSHSIDHLFKLFQLNISTVEPALGIELFILEAPKVEDHFARQEKMWDGISGLEDAGLSELLDHLAVKIGQQSIHRYLPDEHYWPERSIKAVSSLHQMATTAWRVDKLRPLQLLSAPERIEVTAPIPDYPPMLFRYKEKLHKIVKADGPERIEQEWWFQQGQHRDYYRVEDEDGNRYWLFRSGHYDDKTFQWYIHGFFA